MMGNRQRTEPLFHYFRIEDQIPEQHLLRLIDQHVEFGFFRERLKDFYSSTGRLSIDPEVLVRLLLVGYLTVQRASPSAIVANIAPRMASPIARRRSSVKGALRNDAVRRLAIASFLCIGTYEPARQAARALVGTPAYERSRRSRYKIEALFSELKQRIRLPRGYDCAGCGIFLNSFC